MISLPRAAAMLVEDLAYGSRKFAYGRIARLRRLFPAGEKAPVLLIPGVYETWDFLRPLASKLSAAGHPIHVLADLRRNTMPVADAAALAARYLAEHDLRDVVIVAHSKGGLIGKHLMLLDDPDTRVARLIALATPFNGSSRARYFPNKTLREFMPTQSTLAMLTADATVNERITSIYGVLDAHIPEGSELAGARNIRVPVIGHFRILTDERVIGVVVDCADETAPRADVAP